MTRYYQIRRLLENEAGAVAIETAIAMPILLLLSLGGFQISSLVARQTELQAAMAEAQAVALATDPDDAQKLATVKQIVMASTNLAAEKVEINPAFRCNNASSYVTSITYCASGDKVSSYVKIEVSDTYTPIWADYGLGNAISLNQVRYVQYKQATKP